MINDILSSLNLDDYEVKTYLLLLETGPITVGNLAKKLGTPRSSLYGFLKKLQNQGLVAQSIKRGIKTFAAESPEKINLLFNQRMEELQKQQQLYKELLPDLKKQQPSKLINPRLQLFEEEDGLQNALKDMLLYSDIETRAFWPINKMVEILSPDFFRYHNKERIKNNLYTRAIWPKNESVDVKKYPYLGIGEQFKREIRIAPPEIDFSMGYWIYGNKVAFISSREESIGFIIESAEMAEMLSVQFEVVWKMSEPIKVNTDESQAFIKEFRDNF